MHVCNNNTSCTAFILLYTYSAVDDRFFTWNCLVYSYAFAFVQMLIRLKQKAWWIGFWTSFSEVQLLVCTFMILSKFL